MVLSDRESGPLLLFFPLNIQFSVFSNKFVSRFLSGEKNLSLTLHKTMSSCNVGLTNRIIGLIHCLFVQFSLFCILGHEPDMVYLPPQGEFCRP